MMLMVHYLCALVFTQMREGYVQPEPVEAYVACDVWLKSCEADSIVTAAYGFPVVPHVRAEMHLKQRPGMTAKAESCAHAG